MNMFYIYVITSMKDGKNYTGSTGDLRRRFFEHNDGKEPITRNRRPFKLIYYEACLNKYDALKREKYLKTSWGKHYIQNRLKSYLTGKRAYPTGQGSPRVYLKMEEGSGTAANDDSGNARTGTLNGNPIWAPGKYGKGVKLDGTGDYTQVGDF